MGKLHKANQVCHMPENLQQLLASDAVKPVWEDDFKIKTTNT